MGATYKENSPDTRNTKNTDIYNHLNQNGISTSIYDPVADKESFGREIQHKYNIKAKKIRFNYPSSFSFNLQGYKT